MTTRPHEYVIRVEGTYGPKRATVHCWTCGTNDKPVVFHGYTLDLALKDHLRRVTA